MMNNEKIELIDTTLAKDILDNINILRRQIFYQKVANKFNIKTKEPLHKVKNKLSVLLRELKEQENK